MAPKKGGRQDPRKQYFEAIRGGKLDTLRWCLRHGGVSVRAEDDDGFTGVQVAAGGGWADALEALVENVRKVGTPSDLEDADEEGRTPLMMAAFNGKLECCHILVLQGKVKLDAKDEKGKTAKDLAEARKNDKIVKFLSNPTAPAEEEEDDSEDEEAEAKKRVFLASQKSAGQSSATLQQEEVHKQRVAAAEALEKALASAAKPIWPEVEPVIRETRRELSIRAKPALDLATGPVDPAVWQCVCLFELRLEIADRKLTVLPPSVSRLCDLMTLIVSHNALASLPDEIGSLTKLKNLEAASNELSRLPDTLASLSVLQVIDVSSNKITSLAPIAGLTSLVGVNAGNNLLTELPLAWPKLEHLQTLSVPHNQIHTMPPGLGNLQMLGSLDLVGNKIEQVPIELGTLTVKKLQAVKLKDNPLADARIRRFVEDDSPTLVKDLLNHVRKNGYKGDAAGGGGKKGGGKKGKKSKAKSAAAEEEEEGEEDESIADLLAQMNKGSDDDDDAVDVS